jgi:AcrR family transcriptional regulator
MNEGEAMSRTDDTSPAVGLGARAHKKQQTKLDLESAAMRLFAERGYDATSVADIAACVGVSERTFFRYFPTKDAVLFHGVADDFRHLRVALHEHVDTRRPTWSGIEAALTAFAGEMEEKYERLRILAEIIYEAPNVQARLHEIRSQWVEWTSGALAERWGQSPTDARVRMLSAIVLTIWDAANLAWLAGDGTTSLAQRMAEGVATARAALPT